MILSLLILVNFGLTQLGYLYYRNNNYSMPLTYAFNTTCLIFYILMSGLSINSYLNGEMSLLSLNTDTRIYKTSELFNLITNLYVSHNLFATFISIYLNNWIIIGHHIGCILHLYYLSNYPYGHYYHIFYYGLTNISTIYLSFIDIFKKDNILINKYPNLYSIIRTLFAIIFIFFRIIMWSYYNVYFIYDCSIIYYREESNNDLKNFLLINKLVILIFTTLQFFWAKQIVNGVVKSLKKNK